LIGWFPNLKCDTVKPPDLCASNAKYPWTNLSVFCPIILIASWFAPTVPSAPRPQNIHCAVSTGTGSNFSIGSGKFVNVTSSSIPTVK